jgi:hypothetical protein
LVQIEYKFSVMVIRLSFTLLVASPLARAPGRFHLHPFTKTTQCRPQIDPPSQHYV